MLQNKKIIVGITGSISAYKAALLVRLLVKDEADVQVITTEAARRFVADLTFSNLSQKPVFSDLWAGSWSEHVHLGVEADLMIVAPATVNTLAKMANGLCDNALTAVYLSARCPVMVAPAMDADMFAHPQTQANLARLETNGVDVLPVGEGFLASGLVGKGRLLEPELIHAHIREHFAASSALTGKKVLITAGPTREPLDPVRFISNHSSGKMGFALAEAARDAGAEVTLIHGPVSLPAPAGVTTEGIMTAAELYDAVHARFKEQDIVIMAAAVGDYTPATVADEKIKKKPGDGMSIQLARTKDILKSLGAQKEAQILVGFALETQNEEENARGKLKKKNLDYIVLNSLRDKGAGFAHDTNKISILDQTGKIERYSLKSKIQAAKDIIGTIINDHYA